MKTLEECDKAIAELNRRYVAMEVSGPNYNIAYARLCNKASAIAAQSAARRAVEETRSRLESGRQEVGRLRASAEAAAAAVRAGKPATSAPRVRGQL